MLLGCCHCPGEDQVRSASDVSSFVGVTDTCNVCVIAPITFSLTGSWFNGAFPSPCNGDYEGPVSLTYVSGCTWKSSTKAKYHYTDAFSVKQCYTIVGEPNVEPMYELTITTANSGVNLFYTLRQTIYTYNSLGFAPAAVSVFIFTGSFNTGNCLDTRVLTYRRQGSSGSIISNGVGPFGIAEPPSGVYYEFSSPAATATISAT